eukprot:3517727-Prymnesium_polylepis.1
MPGRPPWHGVDPSVDRNQGRMTPSSAASSTSREGKQDAVSAAHLHASSRVPMQDPPRLPHH